MPEQFTGEVEIQETGTASTTITLNGDTGTVTVGGEGDTDGGPGQHTRCRSSLQLCLNERDFFSRDGVLRGHHI